MTQKQIKTLASELVGDGQSPNMWFVTYGPYIANDNGDEWEFELIEGRDREKDTHISGPFDTYEEALREYDEIELDADYGVGQAFIEDRQNGTVNEKWLSKQVKVVYTQSDYDQSRYFYEKNK
jgi:hypothetical protein